MELEIRGGHYVTDLAQTLEFECSNGQSQLPKMIFC